MKTRTPQPAHGPQQVDRSFVGDRTPNQARGQRLAEFPGHIFPGRIDRLRPSFREMNRTGLCRSKTIRPKLFAQSYSPVYGKSPMKRARLMAWLTVCWLTAVQPVLRRPTIRP